MKLAVGASYTITDGLGKGRVGMCAHVHDGSFGRSWADVVLDAPVESVRSHDGKTVVLRKRKADLEPYEE